MPGRKPTSRIHQGLVGERALVGSRYMADPVLRGEYAEEIAPRTELALAKILGELPQRPIQRVLDLGAGTGAAGRAVRAHFGVGVDLVAIDKVAAPGIRAADATRDLCSQGVSGRFDLVVAAHLLNELAGSLGPEEQANLVLRWCRDLLGPDGLCVLLEPALRQTSRSLLQVRDRLVVGGLQVVAPCLYAGPCPALLRERDWCHDAATNPSGHRVDFSYLVLQAHAAITPDPDFFRVVSDVRQEKGRIRAVVCGTSGRHELIRLDRHRRPNNQTLDDLARGERVRICGGETSSSGLRVAADSQVTPVR